MTAILAIDPGMSTGVFWGFYKPKHKLKRITSRQLEGGLDSLIHDSWFIELVGTVDTVVFEKFEPRPMERQYRSDELEPLRIEGFVKYLRPDVHFQSPAAMVLRTGKDQAERKRKSDDVLRKSGLWLTGKDVGFKDANDANAATKHALAYMKNIRHVPSMEAYLV